MNSNLAYKLSDKNYQQDSAETAKIVRIAFTDCGSSDAHGFYLASDSTSTHKLTSDITPKKKRAYDFFAKTDLGEGGYARAPAAEAKQALKAILKRKYNR